MRAHPSRKKTRKREDLRMPAPSHGREERRTRSASRFVRFLLATSPPVSRGVCPRPQAVSPSPHGHRMLVLWSNGPHSDCSCRCARRRPSETPVILVRRPQGTSRPVKKREWPRRWQALRMQGRREALSLAFRAVALRSQGLRREEQEAVLRRRRSPNQATQGRVGAGETIMAVEEAPAWRMKWI